MIYLFLVLSVCTFYISLGLLEVFAGSHRDLLRSGRLSDDREPFGPRAGSCHRRVAIVIFTVLFII